MNDQWSGTLDVRQPDLIEMGGVPRRSRMTFVVVVVLLASSALYYWWNQARHHTSLVRAVATSQPSPALHVGVGYKYGMLDNNQTFFVAFNVQPPQTTDQSATATVDEINGLASPQVYLLPATAMSSVGNGANIADLPSLHSLEKGTPFVVVIVGDIDCEASTATNQDVVVHFAVRSGARLSNIDLTGVSDIGGEPLSGVIAQFCR